MASHGHTSARAAGLNYTDPLAAGISRLRRGGGFSYRSAAGRPVRDPRTLARLRSLVIPPAWTDVWIAPDPCAHIQATGRDAAGRKQYRYHPLWTAERDATKYHRMLAFAEALPAIRRRLAADLRQRPASRRFVLATVIALLERTHFRVGNEEYVRSNQSHGLTTLRDRHVKIRGRRLTFAFRAKGGISQAVEFEDARLARAVRVCQDLPGQVLFQYEDDEGVVRAVTSSDVNNYLRDASGGDFTAKDFRTWAGTLAAAKALDSLELPASVTAGKRSIVEAVDRVADALGNTRAVCRKCYIHPAVLEAYQAGLTIGRMSPRKRASRKLREPEAKLVLLLVKMSPLPQQKKAA